jgi:MFS family permease
MPLFFLNLAHAYDHFFLLIFPTAVLALAPAWGMSYGEALALGTAAFVMFAAGTLPSGWLGDRWSRAHMMTIFFIGIGASAVLTGLAPGPITLVAGLGLLGLFASIYHPVGTALVVQSAARSGRALGINGVYGNMGVAGAALITGGLTQYLGWRAAFIIPGVLAVITGILFARVVGGAGFAPAEASTKTAPKVARPGQIRVFVVVGIGALLGGIVFHGTTISLPKVFEARLVDLADSVAMIGLLVSIVFAIAAFAQIGVGHLLDRFGARAVLPLIVAPQAIFLALAAQAWGWSALAVAIPMMLLVFGEIPIGAWLIGHYTAARWQSRVYALNYVLSLGVSALVVPLLAWLYERSGSFDLAYLLLAGAAAVVALSALMLPRLAVSAPRPASAAAPKSSRAALEPNG